MNENEVSFREHFIKTSEGLTRKQTIEFIYCCAVRSLPFLGRGGTFDFWEEKNLQTHLYSLLWACDIVGATLLIDEMEGIQQAEIALVGVNAAATNAFDLANANPIKTTAARAAKSVETVTRTVSLHDFWSKEVPYNVAFDVYLAGYFVIDFKSILLEDIKAIKSGKRKAVNVQDYGNVWYSFQNALKGIGCEYWGRLYATIFKNNFKLDQETLEVMRNKIRPRTRTHARGFI